MSKENDLRQMFGGLPPSTGVRQLVRTAFELGLDPTGITSKAGTVARKEGRKKVGLFGDAGPYIDNLKEIVHNEKWQQGKQELLKKSRPR